MKFSVAIPAYKVAFLKECIDSVLAQSFLDFELIIVNDASPENVGDLVGGYKHPAIRYYENEVNCGAENVVDNWNKCLSFAAGEFFVLLGDDDVLASDYLAEFLRLMERYSNCDVYHCRTMIIDENSTQIGITEPRPEFESVYDSILQRIKGHRIFFISDYVFRTETLKRNGGFYKLPLAWASDDITAYIAAKRNGIANTNKPVFMYRQSKKTISSTGNTKTKLKAIMLEEKWLTNFLATLPGDSIDKILVKSLKSELPKYIRKKKIYTISASRTDNRIAMLFGLFSKRKVYKLGLYELVFACLLRIRDSRNGQL